MLSTFVSPPPIPIYSFRFSILRPCSVQVFVFPIVRSRIPGPQSRFSPACFPPIPNRKSHRKFSILAADAQVWLRQPIFLTFAGCCASTEKHSAKRNTITFFLISFLSSYCPLLCASCVFRFSPSHLARSR